MYKQRQIMITWVCSERVSFHLGVYLHSSSKVAYMYFSYTVPKNPIYVFPEMKLRGLVPISCILVSVSDLYNPRIGLPIFLQQNRQTTPGNT
jgi:hypothetical protein